MSISSIKKYISNFKKYIYVQEELFTQMFR